MMTESVIEKDPAMNNMSSLPTTPTPPPLEAFFLKSFPDSSSKAAIDEDDDETDTTASESSASESSSSSSSGFFSAYSSGDGVPVREGARVSFLSDPVSEVRIRPTTTDDERSRFFYSYDDIRGFRREFREAVRAKRRAAAAAAASSVSAAEKEENKIVDTYSDDGGEYYRWIGSVLGTLTNAAWSAVPEVIARAESVSRQSLLVEESSRGHGGAAAAIPDRLFHHHGF